MTRCWPGRNTHSLYLVRPLKMRRLVSVLVLATPWKPPTVIVEPAGCENALGRVVVVVVVVVVVRPRPPESGSSGFAPSGPIASPGRIRRHLPSFVIGSL